jgi:hypothetical protein
MADTYTANGGIPKAYAEVVAEEFRKIEKAKGRLSTKELAEELVRRSRPRSSPTHDLFEWDDQKAAEIQRLDRAMAIIAAVYVTFEEQPERKPMKAFPVVIVNGKKGPYPMRKVLASQDLVRAMLEAAKMDMYRFMQRYEGMKELAKVFRAMREIVEVKEVKETRTGPKRRSA